jgi:hypothetical protein
MPASFTHPVRLLASILLLAGTGCSGPQAPPRVAPVTGPTVVVDAPPDAGPPRTDPPLPVDARPPSWGGRLGPLSAVRWLAASGTYQLPASQGRSVTRRTGLFLRPGPSGWRWAYGSADDVPDAAALERTVVYTAVPADVARQLPTLIEDTPVPESPTETDLHPAGEHSADAPTTIEVSTESRHIVARVRGMVFLDDILDPTSAQVPGEPRACTSLVELVRRLHTLHTGVRR